MDDATPARVQHFRQNCLAWAALAHFLPANLLREFCYAIVDLISAGQFKLPDLFEERLFASTEGLDRWEIRPRETSNSLASYLQRRVRTFAWGNDSYVTFEESLAAESGIKPAFLENAVRLGISDFSSPESWFEQVTFPFDQPSILVLRDNIAKVRLPVDSPENPPYRSIVDAIVAAVDMPLAAVTIKHLGDLCADADRWEAALSFYDQSKNSLAKCDRSVWGAFCDALTILTTQSIAAALRSAQGPRTAADYLCPIIEVASLDAASLLIENATQDAYVAASLGSDGQFIPDRRAHLVTPPLFLSSHDLDSALQASINGDYADAHRCFWQILRRQIALGSASESRRTKAFYARSVFEELDKIGTRDHKPDSFWTAVRLLLESGESVIAQRISWSEELIRSYVDHDFIQATIAHAQKYGSASGERLNTLVEMLNGWAEVTAIEQANVAHTMIHFLAATAIENPSSFYGWKDAGGKSIEYIRQLAEKRPEFRIGTADRVTAAIVVKLQRPEWWTGIKEALSAANVYAEVLSEENMTKLVTSTLSLLHPIDPTKNVWVIVQPALNFLSSQAVKKWSAHQRELAEQVIKTILRFGVRQQTEHARLLIRNACVNDGRVESGHEVRSADLLDELPRGRRRSTSSASSREPGRTSLRRAHRGPRPRRADAAAHGPHRRRARQRRRLAPRSVRRRARSTARCGAGARSTCSTSPRRWRWPPGGSRASGFRPKGTLIYLAVADEEALGTPRRRAPRRPRAPTRCAPTT